MQQNTSVVIKQLFTVIVVIIITIIVTFLLANLIDVIRPQTLLQGRNFIRVGILNATLLVCAFAWWSRRYVPQIKNLVIIFLIVEFLLCIPIWFFAGSISADSLFVNWFAGLNFLITLPWLAGAMIGILSRKFKLLK